MPKEDCPRWETCGASICPLNNPGEESTWYPDEEICRKHPAPDWVKNQRKITRKAKDRSKYFTLKMLNRNCRISKGIVGLDTEKDEGPQLKKWLALHPTKKKMSLAQRKVVGERLHRYRQLKKK